MHLLHYLARPPAFTLYRIPRGGGCDLWYCSTCEGGPHLQERRPREIGCGLMLAMQNLANLL